MIALCLRPGPGLLTTRHAVPSPVSESIVVIVGAGPSPPRALRDPLDTGVVDGETVEGWGWQPGWCWWGESSESTGHCK